MDHLLAEGYYYSRFSNGQTICRKSGKQEMVRPEQRHPDLCEHGQSQSQRTAEERLSAALGRQQLLAELIQPENEAPLHPGAIELRDHHDRPGEAQQGERLYRRPLQHGAGAAGYAPPGMSRRRPEPRKAALTRPTRRV